MICLLNTSDYQTGSTPASSATAIFEGSDSGSSESPDSPVSIVSSTSSDTSSKSPSTDFQSPPTPSQRLLDVTSTATLTSKNVDYRQILHGWKSFSVGGDIERHFESPTGEIFTSTKDVVEHIRLFAGLTEVCVNVVDSYFSQVENVENVDDGNGVLAVPFTFCDMQPNIVDVTKKKCRKPSREFNKRRRRSVGKIKSRRSTNSSSTSFDDYDDVGSPLTLELQELLSEVVKSVAERLESVDEEEEHEFRFNLSDDFSAETHPKLRFEVDTTSFNSMILTISTDIPDASESIKCEAASSISNNVQKQPPRIAQRRSTVDGASTPEQSLPSSLKRRSSVDSVSNGKTGGTDNLKDHVTGKPEASEPQVHADCSTNAEPEMRMPEVMDTDVIKDIDNSVETRKRPNSLSLDVQCPKSKLKRLSGSTDTCPEPEDDEFSQPVPSGTLESPEEVFIPPPCNVDDVSDSNGDEEEASNPSLDDFEDEIAACNDFEEVDVPCEDHDEPSQDHEELDPLMLSYEDVGSTTCGGGVETKSCRIDLVDLFSGFRLSSLTCCGCQTGYSGADSLSFDLKARIMFRVCGLCSWWTSRHCRIMLKKY